MPPLLRHRVAPRTRIGELRGCRCELHVLAFRRGPNDLFAPASPSFKMVSRVPFTAGEALSRLVDTPTAAHGPVECTIYAHGSVVAAEGQAIVRYTST